MTFIEELHIKVENYKKKNSPEVLNYLRGVKGDFYFLEEADKEIKRLTTLLSIKGRFPD